jgi:hypothetical protein
MKDRVPETHNEINAPRCRDKFITRRTLLVIPIAVPYDRQVRMRLTHLEPGSNR